MERQLRAYERQTSTNHIRTQNRAHTEAARKRKRTEKKEEREKKGKEGGASIRVLFAGGMNRPR